MIVIGSVALALNGHKPPRPVRDLDLLGEEADIEAIRSLLGDRIDREQPLHGHRHTFALKPGEPFSRIELDYGGTEAEQMLGRLCEKRASVLGLDVRLPTVELLYLIKRAHCARPVHFRKGVADMAWMKPLVGEFTREQIEFFILNRKEMLERYNRHRDRYSLPFAPEEMIPGDVPEFRHVDDVRESIAFVPGRPVHRRAIGENGLFSAALFQELPLEEQLTMMREEFIVTGIDRFFLANRNLSPEKVYDLGLHKTIKDLFTGVIQDFCLERVGLLIPPPDHDFLQRFLDAERDGRVRADPVSPSPPSESHIRIWGLIRARRLPQARMLAEDMIRVAAHGYEPYGYFLLGVALLEAGNTANAAACLRKSISQNAANSMAQYYLGVASRIIGRPAEAETALNNAEHLGYAPPGLFFNRGLALKALGNMEKAHADFEKVRELAPDDPAFAEKLAEISG